MSANPPRSTHYTSIVIDTNLDCLTDLITWFDQFNGAPLAHHEWLEAKIALVEGFTNAARHAHQHLPTSTPITIEVQVIADQFQLCIWDQGEAFDFDANLEAMHQLTHDPAFQPCERDAHWGSIIFLNLINHKGWQISYDRDAQHRNCLKLHKPLSSNAEWGSNA